MCCGRFFPFSCHLHLFSYPLYPLWCPTYQFTYPDIQFNLKPSWDSWILCVWHFYLDSYNLVSEWQHIGQNSFTISTAKWVAVWFSSISKIYIYLFFPSLHLLYINNFIAITDNLLNSNTGWGNSKTLWKDKKINLIAHLGKMGSVCDAEEVD